jgi:hypothetical protein
MLSNSLKMIKKIYTCRSYDKLCVSNIILILVDLLVLLDVLCSYIRKIKINPQVRLML